MALIKFLMSHIGAKHRFGPRHVITTKECEQRNVVIYWLKKENR
jgi:hypothetical protein